MRTCLINLLGLYQTYTVSIYAAMNMYMSIGIFKHDVGTWTSFKNMKTTGGFISAHRIDPIIPIIW